MYLEVKLIQNVKCFFPVESKNCVWISFHMSRRRCRPEEGAYCSHWNPDYLLENLSHKNHENLNAIKKLKHIDDFIFRVLVFF